MSTAPRINAATRMSRAGLLQTKDIQLSAFWNRLDRGIVGHLSAPDWAGATPTRPHGDILLAVNHISGGHSDDPGAELLAAPQHLATLGVECHEMAVGAAAEHQATGGGQRGAGPGQMGFVLPDLFAGIEIHGLHRAPVVGGRIVLDLKGFIEERESRLVSDRLRTLDVHTGVLRWDVRHLGLWIDRHRPPVLAAEEARTDEDLFVACWPSGRG